MSSKGTGKMGGREEPSLERGKFRSKGLKEGDDDVRVFFKEPHNVRGKDRLLCFVSEHTVHQAPRARPPGTAPGTSSTVASAVVRTGLDMCGASAAALALAAARAGAGAAIGLRVAGGQRACCVCSQPIDILPRLVCVCVSVCLSVCLQRYPFVVVYNDAKWNLEKRFSDFAELDAALDEAFKNNEDVTLPEFPPKKYFGSLSPALIKERQEGLEKYMKSLVKDSEVLQCRSLREFLETPDIVGKDKHKEYDFGRR